MAQLKKDHAALQDKNAELETQMSEQENTIADLHAKRIELDSDVSQLTGAIPCPDV